VGGPLAESCLVGNSCLEESRLVCIEVVGVELRWASRLLEKFDMNERTVNITCQHNSYIIYRAAALTNLDF
jgi:hypothetical protein